MTSAAFYAAAVIFLAANVWRFVKIARMPVHLRWELYPVPHEPPQKVRYGGSYMEESEWWSRERQPNRLGGLAFMIPEVLFLRGVWERNRPLWLWSWLMHLGMYFLVAATLLLLVGLSPDVTEPVLVAAGALGLVGAMGVAVLRVGSPKLRNFTSPAALFNLVFLLVLFALPLVSSAATAQPTAQMADLVRAALRLQPPPQVSGWVTAGFWVTALFAVYFPFTHMTHAYTKWFTWDKIRWDDSPLAEDGRRARKIIQALDYPVGWSAPHIRGEDRKTWAQVVTERGTEDA